MEICDGMTVQSGESEKQTEDVRQLFARGVKTYQTGGPEPAFKELERLARFARTKGNTVLASRVTALLGLILLETGDLTGALQQLRAAQREIPNPEECHWYGLLFSLSNITAANVATEQARLTITKTRDQIVEEIQQLTSEIKTKSSHLWQILITPLENSGPETPATQKIGLHKAVDTIPIFVHLLGRFQVHMRGDAPVALCSNRKGRALFMVLVSHQGQRIHRETLVDLLWRGEDPDIAIGKMHIAVSRLRRALVKAGLGDEPLIFDQSNYALNEHIEVESDLSNFQSHAAIGKELESHGDIERAVQAYIAACSLYQGPFLEDIVDEDWHLTLRSQCEATLLHLLDRLSYWSFTRKQFINCENYCRQLLEYDDLREDICRRLMRSLSHSGQRNQAIRCYRKLQELLKVELGVEPMRETQALFSAILNEENIELASSDNSAARHQNPGEIPLSDTG